jgi:hypothetical protein
MSQEPTSAYDDAYIGTPRCTIGIAMQLVLGSRRPVLLTTSSIISRESMVRNRAHPEYAEPSIAAIRLRQK